jgi:ABC-type cobalamin/Fe3+-siderophores transport system ATPase subunit
VVGSDGAGRSTLLKSVTDVLPSGTGVVLLGDGSINRSRPINWRARARRSDAQSVSLSRGPSCARDIGLDVRPSVGHREDLRSSQVLLSRDDLGEVFLGRST